MSTQPFDESLASSAATPEESPVVFDTPNSSEASRSLNLGTKTAMNSFQSQSKCPFSKLKEQADDAAAQPPAPTTASKCPYSAMYNQSNLQGPAEMKNTVTDPALPQVPPSPATTTVSLSSTGAGLGLSRTGSADSVGSSGKSRPRRLLEPVHYHSYLQLDTLLSAQKPKSLEVSGVMAHDEMLFIIVHQAHELWFKQIAHDLNSVLEIMSGDMVAERELSRVVERLTRLTKIQKMLVEHLTVLETMTPLSFLDFREYLYPASGFQSMQFRNLEVRLGLRRAMRATYAGQGARYECALTPEQAEQIIALEKEPSLFDLVDKWLARLPVLKTEDFDFWTEYQNAVASMFAQDEADLKAQYDQGLISESLVSSRLNEIGKQRQFFKQFFDEEWYEHTVASGARRLSYRACQAALMINFYQEEPLFQIPFQLLTLLLEIDANFTAWRSKHAQMVHRMLGLKMGTGGSSGFSYLMQAVNDHKIFNEFFNLASLMVPRAFLPTLPESVNRQTRFFYRSHDHHDTNATKTQSSIETPYSESRNLTTTESTTDSPRSD